MTAKWIDTFGKVSLDACTYLGHLGMFLVDASRTLATTKLKPQKVLYQMLHVGVNSFSVIFLSGTSVGCVLAYQSFIGLHRFGGEQFIGPVVFLSMVREFGPVLSGIMVTARAGSSMTAEIGTMRITEQIDALETLSINPHQYLTVPRIIATTCILPFLSLFCTLCGIVGGFMISIHMLGVNPEMYMKAVRENVLLFDITSGLIKAAVFGFLLSWIATYKGYTTFGGAKGVGIATTQSVVMACVAIFIADYILTALMF